MREPLDAAGDNSIRKLHWMWPPGAGKTTAIEGAIQWRVVESPSNVLLVGQKDETAGLWAETRLHPSFKKSEAMRPFMPENRHQNRKTTVVFPHGIYLDICGPSMTNLQEKSMPWVMLEEAWQLSDNYPGRMKEAEARTHDKWNSKVFYIGQGGNSHAEGAVDENDSETDLYREWKKTDQREFHFRCPKCETIQKFLWNQLKWDKEHLPDGAINWDKTNETVRYVCANPDCAEEFRDTSIQRRALAKTGRYIATNQNAIKGHVGFHCNVLAIWRIPWAKAVMEWEEAQEAKLKGDWSLLQIFIKKRLAEFWKPSAYEAPSELISGGYLIADYEDGRLIDNEADRCLCADIQQNSMWYSIRACDSEGNSKLLNCGQLHTFEEIEAARIKYQVKPKCVLVDAQYRKDFVYQQCSKYGWTAYHGAQQDSFPINTASGIIKAPYSRIQSGQSGNGMRMSFLNLCVNPIKDVLADLRAGRLGRWEFPDDVSPDYKKHMNAERKVTVIEGKENRQRQIWQRIGKKDNHLLDTEMAATGFMMMRGHVKQPETD
jgi:phage terminase large subunit GpA-like protein